MPSFQPDSALVDRVLVSPNHDTRGRSIDMIVLHYTGMRSTDAALQRLCDPAARVSSHYVVLEDGEICQLVPEAERAWHAGVSSWEGETDINARSIGIEIANPGHDLGYPDFPDAQIAAVIA
ncbi:MAG: N-acetylmuramoyl-L-alanine amidase, partial [Xanthobacteraceae bacterium]